MVVVADVGAPVALTGEPFEFARREREVAAGGVDGVVVDRGDRSDRADGAGVEAPVKKR
ncbi:MAG: hypothetical protein KDB37_19340 [Ilumatobacter sp.]|nr:hypothetical protein [Ilumatobacter sp.]